MSSPGGNWIARTRGDSHASRSVPHDTAPHHTPIPYSRPRPRPFRRVGTGISSVRFGSARFGAVERSVGRCHPTQVAGLDSVAVRVRESALGGHSGGATPVPIPNTEDKPASVPGSTGVREPLGTPVRRLPFILSFVFRPRTVVRTVRLSTTTSSASSSSTSSSSSSSRSGVPSVWFGSGRIGAGDSPFSGE